MTAGLPHDSRPWKNGNLTEFNVAEVFAWVLEFETGKARGDDASEVATSGDPGRRLITAQAEKAELQVEVMRGELLPADEVERVWSRAWSVARDLFRSIPKSCVDRVLAAAANGRVAVAKVLQEEIDDALARASALDVTIEIDDGDEAPA